MKPRRKCNFSLGLESLDRRSLPSSLGVIPHPDASSVHAEAVHVKSYKVSGGGTAVPTGETSNGRVTVLTVGLDGSANPFGSFTGTVGLGFKNPNLTGQGKGSGTLATQDGTLTFNISEKLARTGIYKGTMTVTGGTGTYAHARGVISTTITLESVTAGQFKLSGSVRY